MDERTEKSLDELEAVAQMAFSQLATLHERQMLCPRSDSLTTLNVARQLWEGAKRALEERRRGATRRLDLFRP